MKKSSYTPKVFQHAVALLAQAAPVQDQWYDILPETRNAKIIQVSFEVATTNETLEWRIIIDGQTYTQTGIAAVANTDYYASISITPAGVAASSGAPVQMFVLGAANDQGVALEGRVIQIQMRKTTAAGAGNLNACCLYGQMS